MTCVGTLKANRKGIPKHLKEIRNRPEGDYQVVYEEGTHKSLHSWVTNTKSGPKNIMIITTTCPIIGKTKDDNMEKPALYKRYDFAMGGTDRCDQLSESKTVRIKSRRWTLSPLCYMLDVSRVNARTVGLLQGGREILDTRNFARQLVRELVTPHIKRRLKKKGIQKFVKIKAECYLKKEKEGEDEEQEEEEQEEQEQEEGEQEEAESVQVEDPETPLRGTKRCSACLTLSENYKSSLNLKKSKTICRSCEKVFCMKHLLLTCSSCGGGPPPEQQGEQLPLQLIETLRGHLPRRVFQQLLLQLPRQPPHRGQQPLSQQLTSRPPHQPPHPSSLPPQHAQRPSVGQLYVDVQQPNLGQQPDLLRQRHLQSQSHWSHQRPLQQCQQSPREGLLQENQQSPHLFQMPQPILVSPSPARGSIFRSVGVVSPLDTSLESPRSEGSESSLECRRFPQSPAVSGTVIS